MAASWLAKRRTAPPILAEVLPPPDAPEHRMIAQRNAARRAD